MSSIPTPSQATIHRLPPQSLSQLIGTTSTPPISTSIKYFDEALDGGFQSGSLYEISAINGSGKSSLAAQLVYNCLQMGKQVLWISTLQSIPLQKLRDMCEPELLENLHHIRLNTIGSLLLFLQSLPLKKTKYSLIIIDDFMSCITRCFDEHEIMINPQHLKSKQNALESKKNRSIQTLLKLISTYCATNNASCVLFNSSTILNMSFVETKKHESSQVPSSSVQFSSQNPSQKPKRFYQQILVSPMGDHPFWSQYFKARMMLYRDWLSSSSSSTTAIFVHLKFNSLVSKVHTPKVISFQESPKGLVEVSKDLNLSISNSSNSFTLEEEDFEDFENEETEMRTTAMNEHPVLLMNSSPRHKGISTAKDILPDDLTNEVSSQVASQAASTKEIEKSMEEEQNEQGDDEENDSSIVQLNENQFENSDIQSTPGPIIENQSDKVVNENCDKENDNLQFSVPMVEDTTVEIEEIEDELEELYPTQPESLSFIQLSQIHNSQSQTSKRSFPSPSSKTRSVKKIRHPLRDFTNEYHQESYQTQLSSDEYIPASAPYF